MLSAARANAKAQEASAGLPLSDPYASTGSASARARLEEHFTAGANLYKFWGNPSSVVRAIFLGWARSRHPAHLHYAWDLESSPSLDHAILETTRQAMALLDLDGIAEPHLFEPGCGIGGGVTQVAHMLPNATITGLSLVESQLCVARARAIAENVAATTALVCGNYLRSPFASGSFDGIFAIETLVYVPAAERGLLFRELLRLLRPGRRLVCLDGFRVRDPATATERDIIQTVMDGWTLPLPALAGEFSAHAREAGFELVAQQDLTSHIRASAQRIASIGAGILRPLYALASVPGLRRLLLPLGFASPAHARRFVAACCAQVKLFELGLGAYYVHVFRKPD